MVCWGFGRAPLGRAIHSYAGKRYARAGIHCYPSRNCLNYDLYDLRMDYDFSGISGIKAEGKNHPV
jgi:hypothetical protein